MRPALQHRLSRTGALGRPLSLLLRLAGAVVVLLALTMPRSGLEAAPPRVVDGASSLGQHAYDEDGGACGEADEEQELIECGAKLEQTLDEPLLIALMRTLEVHMSEQACTELLVDLWSEQTTCQAEGRECGKMNSGAPPGPPPKLASSSSSAQSSWASLGLRGGASGTLELDGEVRALDSRDLQPPDPPPKLGAH